MRIRTIAILALAVSALLLAACQTNDGDPVESVFRFLVKAAAADAADFDSLGLSIAIDGSYALVGTPGVDGAGSNRGAAYLFLQSQGAEPGWGQIKKLLPDDPADGDLFGLSVAISGDYAVVGAGAEDGAGTDLGAVYVFYRDQGGADNWGQVKKIAAADGENDDGFGFAVALDGDVLIVGADGADGSGVDQGAAYVFYRDRGGAGNWGQVAKLFSNLPADTNQFGFAVAIGGGVAAVGSPGEDGDGVECGVVYIFSRDQGGVDAWGLTKSFSPSDTPDQTWLGTAVAIDGMTAVIGSPWDDGAGTSRGAVHVLGRDQGGPGNWGEVKKLVASDMHDNDLFGYSVAIDGAYILAGAGWARGGGTERGQAYLFARDEGGPGNWGEVQSIRASDGANEDWFGSSVGIDGLHLVIGSPGEDGAGSDRGAAYVFKKI